MASDGRSGRRQTRRTFVSGALAGGALGGCLSLYASQTPFATDGEDDAGTPTTEQPTDTPTRAPEETGSPSDGGTIMIDSLESLRKHASKSDQNVWMKPGIYDFAEVLTDDDIQRMQDERLIKFLEFSGDNNVFDLTGVTLKIPTSVRGQVNSKTHGTREVLVSGDDNTIRGLEITDIGETPSDQGNTFQVSGDRTTIVGMKLVVRGSEPYGYGGLLGGAGGPAVPGVSWEKQSGFRVVAEDVRVYDTRLYMYTYGHGYYLQEDARNAYFENCYVEGRMRPTDEILAETEGPAYENDFQSAYQNKDGELKIPPGYMKSLSEDGFRTYGTSGHTFVNCTIKNMRSGFELRGSGPQRVLNCRVIGTNRGIWVGSDSEVRGCRADFTYGPAVMVEGTNSTVEVDIDPISSEYNVPAAVILGGRNNDVRIQASDGRRNPFEGIDLPIKLGFDPGLHGAVTAPVRVSGTIEGWPIVGPPVEGYSLENDTTLPIEISEVVKGARVDTHGPVEAHADANIEVTNR